VQSPGRSDVQRWGGFAGAAGGLVSVLMLAGCPGTLDPAEFQAGSGGSTATGGSGQTGGSTGSGGAAASCTGGNDGATIVTNNCATSDCHDPAGASFSGGLDLTVDSGISARLVGVTSQGTANNGSSCMGESEPYLVAQSNPATGLVIDKIGPNPPCGSRMPFVGPTLSTTQQTCLIQWATTLTSP
jgi:hypothetical protein